MESIEPALTIINHRRKAEGFVKGCRAIQAQGFEAFKANAKLRGIEALQALPYIGPITKKHLARNMGLLDVSKDDVWLVRLAREFDARDVEQLTNVLAERFNEKKGVIDLVLWRFCADGGWSEWQKTKEPVATKATL